MLVLVLALHTAWAQAPSDAGTPAAQVQRAVQLVGDLERNPSSPTRDALRGQMKRILRSSFQRVWQVQTSGGGVSPTEQMVTSQLQGYHGTYLSSMNSTDGPKLMDALRRYSSGEIAARVVANILLSPPPGELLASVDDESVFYDISGPGRWPLPTDQLRIQSTSRQFKVDTEHSAIVAEHGLDGRNNGRVDVGEWAKIRIAVEDPGPMEPFSTSAWPGAHHPCLIVPPGEIELTEPGEETPAFFDVWIHRPFDCDTTDRLTAAIQLQDSRWPDSGELVLTFDRSPPVIGQLADVQMDMDDAGSSEPWAAGTLQPDTFGEVSASLAHSIAGATDARMIIRPNRTAIAFMERQNMREVDMVRGTPGRFEPGDDLDFQVTHNYRSTFLSLTDPWLKGETPRVWFAVDVEVRRSAAAGLHRAKPDMVSVDDGPKLYGVVHPYLNLEAVETKPIRDGDLLFSDGIALVFDAEKWVEDHPPNDWPSGHGYRFRRYISLPVSPVLTVQPKKKAPPPRVATTRPEAPPAELTWKLDGGVVLVKHEGFDPDHDFDDVDFTDEESYARTRARALHRVAGPVWWLVDSQVRLWSDAIVDEGDLRVSEVTAASGFALDVLDKITGFDIEPHVAFGVVATSFDGSTDKESVALDAGGAVTDSGDDSSAEGQVGWTAGQGASTAPLIDLGLTVRWSLLSPMHVYSEMAYHIAQGAELGESQPVVMSRTGLRFSAGVGGRF